jgi:hypothetical protein
MTQYGTWVSYESPGSLTLAVILLAVAVILAYAGTRQGRPLGVKQPGKAAAVFMTLTWLLSIMMLLVAAIAYTVQLTEEYLGGTPPANPVTVVTLLSALCSFVLVAYINRKQGLRRPLLGAALCAMAGPMIFELPFDLIVLQRTYPPIPPSPGLYRALFFIPLFLVELSTLSLLTLSPLMRLTRYTFFALAGMFLVFAVWAVFGFAYPSSPTLIVFNAISKILAFVAAITLFLPQKQALSEQDHALRGSTTYGKAAS